MEDSVTYGILLTEQASGGGAASGNYITATRHEIASGVGIQITAVNSPTAIKFNYIAHPYFSLSGSASSAVDNTNANTWVQGEFLAETGTPYNTLFNNPSGNGYEYVGINRTPAQINSDMAGYTGGLDIGGNLNVTGGATFNGTITETTASGALSHNFNPASSGTTLNFKVGGTLAYALNASASSFSIYDSANLYAPLAALAGGSTLLYAVPGNTANVFLSGHNIVWDTNTSSHVAAGQLASDGSIYLGFNTASANFFHLTGTATGARTVTLPDANTTTVVVSSSAVVGYAACLKASSPPTWGTCSTQPTSTGACTCN
jgi:hypothetical protein